MQLITKVQVAPNNVDDNQLMAEALPNLKERTGVKIMITDGGYGGEAIDQALQDAKIVTLIQTAIRRAQTDSNQFSLSDFSFQQDEGGRPTTLTCPQGQTIPVTPWAHHWLAGKLPVREKFRVTCKAIASAVTTNVRRIQCYLLAKTKAEQAVKITKEEPYCPSKQPIASFVEFLSALLIRWSGLQQASCSNIVC